MKDKKDDSGDYKRQAVVVIHGIGEQRPMATLRSFVSSILNYEKHINGYTQDDRTFWTKPDRINDSYELRKISAKGFKNVRSGTHFYEYHWASNMRDTKYSHVVSWFLSLLTKSPFNKNFRFRILILWLILWFLTFAFVNYFFLYVGSFIWDYQIFNDNINKIQGALPLIIPFILFVIQNIFIGYIGDAARYLHVDVNNIKQRELIRKNGIDLIKDLHKTEDYDRIIIVGHSLGSIIAYDIVSYLWIEFNKSINFAQEEDEIEIEDENHAWGWTFGALKADDDDLKSLLNTTNTVRNTLDENNKTAIDEKQQIIRNAQHNLSNKINFGRKGWLVTDLVTVGSPLSHGSLLLADSEEDFYLRIEEREYPICPPIREVRKNKENIDEYFYWYENAEGEKNIHHAMPFGFTRWTNIYYKGDFIGGKVSNSFGFGIKDKHITYNGSVLKKLLGYINPGSHNHYWATKCTKENVSYKKEYNSIQEIYNAMRLNDKEIGLYEKIETKE